MRVLKSNRSPTYTEYIFHRNFIINFPQRGVRIRVEKLLKSCINKLHKVTGKTDFISVIASIHTVPAAKVSIGTVNEAGCKPAINRGCVPRWKKPDNVRFIAGNRCCLAVKSRGVQARSHNRSPPRFETGERLSTMSLCQPMTLKDDNWYVYLRGGTSRTRAYRNRVLQASVIPWVLNLIPCLVAWLRFVGGYRKGEITVTNPDS